MNKLYERLERETMERRAAAIKAGFDPGPWEPCFICYPQGDHNGMPCWPCMTQITRFIEMTAAFVGAFESLVLFLEDEDVDEEGDSL